MKSAIRRLTHGIPELLRFFLAIVLLVPLLITSVIYDIYKRIFHEDVGWKTLIKQLDNRYKKNSSSWVSVHDIIIRDGYIVEDHVVQTIDGYLLTVHRLKSPKVKSYRGSVVLQHGLYQSSMLFVVNKPSDSLAYILADMGYDVWLGNNRGNIHSRSHVSLYSSDPKFWDWGIDELVYDVEAITSYVKTQSDSDLPLYYIGHSQGAAQGIAALSSNATIRSRVRLMIALAPGAFVKVMPCLPLVILSKIVHYTPTLYYLIFGRGAFLPYMECLRHILPLWMFQYFAYVVFHFLFEWGDKNWDDTRKSYYFAETPSGTSSRTIAQWMQHSITGRFQKYCFHSKKENNKIYDTTFVPEYPLDELNNPVAVIYGGKDDLIDFNRLIESLPNCIYSKCIEHHEHLDTLLANDCKQTVFPSILSLLEDYESIGNTKEKIQFNKKLETETNNIYSKAESIKEACDSFLYCTCHKSTVLEASCLRCA